MIDLPPVARTLLLPLRARAEEHARPAALFRDPLAARWSAELPWPPEFDPLYDWRIQAGAAIRSRVFDDLTVQFLDAHPRALVVELGAGLSTRYARLGRDRTPWVEIDLPEAVAVRRRLEAETDAHRFLAASLAGLGWLDRLPPAYPSDVLLIAEGVLMFLPIEEVVDLVAALRATLPGASVLLDVLGRAGGEGLGPRFAAIEAPLRWVVRDERDVAALGLEPVDVRPILRQFPARWGEIADLPWTDELRNVGLLIAARVPVPTT